MTNQLQQEVISRVKAIMTIRNFHRWGPSMEKIWCCQWWFYQWYRVKMINFENKTDLRLKWFRSVYNFLPSNTHLWKKCKDKIWRWFSWLWNKRSFNVRTASKYLRHRDVTIMRYYCFRLHWSSHTWLFPTNRRFPENIILQRSHLISICMGYMNSVLHDLVFVTNFVYGESSHWRKKYRESMY